MYRKSDSTDSVYYSFVANANATAIRFSIESTPDTNFSHIHKVILYKGACNTLSALDSVSGDSVMSIGSNLLTVGNSYFLLVITNVSGCPKCQKINAKYQICRSFSSGCVAVSQCSLIQNGSFSDDSPVGSALTTGDPFTLGRVCFWAAMYGTPQVTTTTPNTNPYSARMWCLFQSNIGLNVGEGILAPVNIQSGKIYVLNYSSRRDPTNTTSFPIDNYNVFLSQSANSGLPIGSSSSLPPLPAISQLVSHQTAFSSNAWILNTLCFTANSNFDQLSIYPYMNNNTATNDQQTWLGIDELIPGLLLMD